VKIHRMIVIVYLLYMSSCVVSLNLYAEEEINDGQDEDGKNTRIPHLFALCS